MSRVRNQHGAGTRKHGGVPLTKGRPGLRGHDFIFQQLLSSHKGYCQLLKNASEDQHDQQVMVTSRSWGPTGGTVSAAGTDRVSAAHGASDRLLTTEGTKQDTCNSA